MQYPGGKNNCYQQIINLIPPHDTYIEAFLGSGAVLRHKGVVNNIVDLNVSRFLPVDGIPLNPRSRTHRAESGGRQRISIPGSKLIPRQLPANELIEGHVRIQGPNHKVPNQKV